MNGASLKRAAAGPRLTLSPSLSLALMLCLVLAPAGAAERRAPVRLCFEQTNVLPWRTESGAGLNFALLKMVEQKLDLRFEFQSIPWKRCLAQLKANAVDGAFAVSYKPDRRSLGEYPGGAVVDASKRMHIDSYMVLRRRGSKVEWDGKSFRNLDGAVGFQLGYSVGDVLRGLNVEVDEGSQRADELARKLIAGRVAAAAVGGSDAQSLLQGPLGGQLEQLPIPIIEKPYFLILSHGLVAADPQLAERIWRAVEEARNSAAYRKLEAAEGARH